MSQPPLETTVFLQLDAEFYSHNPDVVRRIRPVRMTQKRPEHPVPGTILVKLTLRVPASAFLPLRPQVVVVIPEDMTLASLPIEVEAGDASAT